METVKRLLKNVISYFLQTIAVTFAP